MIYHLIILGAFLLLLKCVVLEPDVVEEYCETDIFRARCGNRVILMEHARFGRMALGKCLKLDFGFMDCFSDVLPEMDRLCSGQPTCDVRVNDLAILTQPCPFELRSYLEARYTCLAIINPSPQCCRLHSNQVLVDVGNGYIASSVTVNSGCGARDCPWKIRSSNAQKIDLNILDFGYNSRHANDEGYVSGGKCNLYAIINEISVGYTFNVCAGTERRRHLYTTSSNSVEVSIVLEESEGSTQQTHFILEFKALGCADPIPPKEGSVQRYGDHAQITCLGQDGATWEIVCHEGLWTGIFGNCSGGSSLPGNSHLETPSQQTRFHFSVAIITIVVVAVIVAMTLLIIGVICMIKKSSNPPQSAQNIQQQYGSKTRDISYPAERYKDENISLCTDDNYVNPRDNYRNLPVATTKPFAQTICLRDRDIAAACN